ncbi:MAG: hypothetical protein LBE36_06415 [Flavobacteriaceae bacterium]|jgi:hypothetical protein|nr:hypothetical protein [Flavobacteriaceae bacterium]
MANCFEDTKIENVDHCPNDESVGGLAVDLFYVPKDHIDAYLLPVVTPSSKYVERISLPANAITLKAQKSWKKISVMVDENELTSTLVGNKGNKKSKVEMDVLIPNFTAKNIGFQDAHKNTPMIFAVADSTGQKWVIGTLNAPAQFETSDAKTGKKYDDNSGITGKISANTKLYALQDDIVVEPDV